jgi:hypothetical protein
LIDYGLDPMAVTEIVKRMGKSMHGILSTTATENPDEQPERLLIFKNTDISKLRTEVHYCSLFSVRNAFRSSKLIP